MEIKSGYIGELVLKVLAAIRGDDGLGPLERYRKKANESPYQPDLCRHLSPIRGALRRGGVQSPSH